MLQRQGPPCDFHAFASVASLATLTRCHVPPAKKTHPLNESQARRLWLHAQRLDVAAPFGDGPEATRAAIEHLGYVQIDTINVIERSHHHVLYSRIPGYRREDLRQAQSVDKTVFEYWTHALSYVPTRDLRFFLGEMKKLPAARRAAGSAR